MALTDFTRDFSNVIERAGGVFVDDGGQWRDMGVVKNVQISFSPVQTEADVGGRQKMLAADVTIEFVMQQTSATELAALVDVIDASGSGLKFKVTEDKVGASGAAAASGMTISNATASVNGTIMFDSSESNLSFSIAGRLSTADLAAFLSGADTNFGA